MKTISEFFSDYNEIGHDREMKGSNFGNKILTKYANICMNNFLKLFSSSSISNTCEI